MGETAEGSPGETESPVTSVARRLRWWLRVTLRTLFRSGRGIAFWLLGPLLLETEELRRYAAEAGMLIEFDSARAFTLDPPVDPPELTGRVAKRVGRHSQPQPFVCELRDSLLLGQYPVALIGKYLVVDAVVRRGVVLLNLAGSLRALLSRPLGVLGLLRNDAEYDTACLLYNRWSSGYFHWMFESVTRIEGVERYAERTGREPTLVLGPDPSSWQRQTLELVGYDAEDWTTWTGVRARVERLVVPTVRRGTVLSPSAVEWLRTRVHDRMAANEYPDPADYPDRVYVSRDDAERRRVTNEDEVMDALSPFGFSRFVLSEMDVAEQVALYMGADVVVAPHGAGLTNMVFSEDLSVVELFRDGDVRGQYYQIAALCDFDYRYRIEDRDGPDLRVDTDRLRETVADIVSVEEAANSAH